MIANVGLLQVETKCMVYQTFTHFLRQYEPTSSSKELSEQLQQLIATKPDVNALLRYRQLSFLISLSPIGHIIPSKYVSHLVLAQADTH